MFMQDERSGPIGSFWSFLRWIEFDCVTQLPMSEWGWRWCWYEPGLCFDKRDDGWISFVFRKVCWTVLMQHAIIISNTHILNFPKHAKRWLYPQSSVIPLTLNLSSQCPRHSFESTILRVCCRLGKTANEAVKLPGLTGSSRSWSPIIWFDPLHKPFMWSICNICWIPCEIGLVFFCDSSPSLANMNCIIGQLWYAIHASLEHMKGQIWLGITLGIIQGRQCPFCWFQLHLPCGKATGNDTWLVPVGQLKASGRWANPRWFAYDLEGVVIPEMIHIQHARLF